MPPSIRSLRSCESSLRRCSQSPFSDEYPDSRRTTFASPQQPHGQRRDPNPGANRNRRRSGLQFELAGPRAKLFFDPKQTRAGIVTCGGLCPGLNNVIRSLFLELHYGYGVAEVLGFRGGYSGLDPANGVEPVKITPQFIDGIHQKGGTILGSSRGPVDIGIAVDNLVARGVNILFTVGGDGTQRGRTNFTRKREGGATRSQSSASRRPSTTTSVSFRAPSDSSARSKKQRACSIVRTPRLAACPVGSAS